MICRYFAFTGLNRLYMKSLYYPVIILFWVFAAAPLRAQNAIGQWKDYLSYINSTDVVALGQKIYVANENALFIYDTRDNSLQRLNKINGLSGVGISSISVYPDRNLILIGYNDGYIDLLENNAITPFAAIKNSAVVGDKAIRQVTFHENKAYLATGVGILEFDLDKREVRDTYSILPEGNLAINQTAILHDTLYAATPTGLYRGALSSDLTIFSNWSADPTVPSPGQEVKFTAAQSGRLYIYQPQLTAPGLYARSDSMTWHKISDSPDITVMESSPKGVVFSTGYYCVLLKPGGFGLAATITEYGSDPIRPRALTTDETGIIWIADRDKGLVKWEDQNSYAFIAPGGPATNSAFALDFYDDQLWITTGETVRPGNWNNQYRIDGFYGLLDGKWNNFTRRTDPVLIDSLFFDSPAIHVDRNDPARVYVGSMYSGFIEIKDLEIQGIFSAYNSSLGERTEIDRDDGKPYVGVAGFANDANGNLWITNPYASSPLSVRTEAGTWKSFPLSGTSGLGVNKVLTSLIVDDYGQKWAVVNRGGVVVFSEGSSIIDASDDKVRLMTAETGKGGLPVNEVECIAKDLDGEVWVGTLDGIAVFYAPFDALTPGFSDARRVLIEQNGVFQYLLQGQSVSSIAIDGANRKWIGTFGAGVFLQSQDGTQQIQRFTAENSPLLSNVVKDIAINPANGEVFFATDRGVISYTSDATGGNLSNECATVYPNPVRENYNGPIAITGLMRDSQVRITDTRGNLVFKTTSNGGKAIWDGTNMNGVRVSTGVYFALVSDKDGESKCVSKVLVIK